ncbi:MAG: efflux RND transporter periplasmic adaptor subunit [Bacteroidales bacterium]|jgi:Cu(I)/Ag(I) efflux system membrane fusion protein|nr:efflux RND transporter periplasmic adaptor subunit [Bacteroidales bacterium]
MKTMIKNIKENYKLVIGVLVVGILLGWLIFPSSGNSQMSDTAGIHEGHDHESEESTTWTCSMHPQIKQDKPGDCPICGMDLIPLESMDSGDEDFDPNEVMMTESAAKLADIQTTKVVQGNPVKEIYLQGKVVADERNMAELTARFGGRIEMLYVNFTGKKVQKGEKLATIYSPDLVTAQRELIEALAIKDSRPALYHAARAKLKLWDLTEEQIDQIESQGEPRLYFDILSPISGTVMERHVSLGDYVKMGDPLFKVSDLSRLWVLFDAYEEDLPWIKTGDRMEFTVQSVPGKTFVAEVDFIDPFIHPDTRSARVRVEVGNKEQKLKPEMFAAGKLYSRVAANKQKLIIPKSSVLWTGKRAVVYVKVSERENPTFIYREIVLGPRAGDSYVVESGLSGGEEIATNGVFKIDASAQLEGKKSMMNPSSDIVPASHDHGNGKGTTSEDHQAAHARETAEASGHVMFEVGGACEMCKERIESAASSVKGVTSAEWSIKNHILHVSYDSKNVILDNVHKAIAAAGHDTEKMKAPDSVYNNLPDCCLYERLSYDKQAMAVKTSEFFVNGACGMCKERIEKAAFTVNGVKEANWNQETKILQVTINKEFDILEIHKAVAGVGHDTKKIKAEDSVYNALPGCCLYRDE